MWTYPDTGPSFFNTLQLASYRHLVALLICVAAIRVWKMNVAAGLLHHLLDGHPSLAYDVRVVSIAHVQFHCHTVALKEMRLLQNTNSETSEHFPFLQNTYKRVNILFY